MSPYVLGENYWLRVDGRLKGAINRLSTMMIVGKPPVELIKQMGIVRGDLIEALRIYEKEKKV
jgi:hypothetical protein